MRTKIKQIILYIMIVIVCMLIFHFSAQPAEKSSKTSAKVIEIISKVCNLQPNNSTQGIEDTIESGQKYVRKSAHFLIYTLLGFLIMNAYLQKEKIKRKDIFVSWILGTIYAITDEVHQFFVPGRSAEIRDVCIDSLGVITGVVLANIVMQTIKNNTEKRKTSELKKKKRVMFIASTGGHFDELMQLKPIFNDYEYKIVTERTPLSKELKEKYGDKIEFLIYGTRKNILTYIFKFTLNFIKSVIIYIQYKPEVIITTGTHTAVPMCYIGKILGSKIIYIETFANKTTKTLTGKIVYPIADVFVVQWEEMLKLYPKAVYWGWIY